MNGSTWVYSGLLHSHLAGVEVKVRQVRNGVELPPILWDRYYDFSYQKPMIRFDSPIEIRPGDDLIVECTYDTTSPMRPNVTIGGESTHDEMCMAFMDVHPPLIDLAPMCLSVVYPEATVPALGGRMFGYGDTPYNGWIIDNQGNYRDYHDWLNSLDWHGNNGSLIAKLQDYIYNQPVYLECELQTSLWKGKPNLLEDPYFFIQSAPTNISQPYKQPVNRQCAKLATHEASYSLVMLLGTLAMFVAQHTM